MLTALGLLCLVALPAYGGNGQEVCPEEGKVESVIDGDLDGIVLEDGTQVCIKGSTDVVYVTADGVSTLFELLGNGHNVSHYTVLETPETTTTTTVPEETTTTAPSETTTTTVVETTTTTAPEVTTTVPEETTTTVTETTITSPPTDPPTELPYTGPEDVWLAGLGAALLAGGGALVLWARKEEMAA